MNSSDIHPNTIKVQRTILDLTCQEAEIFLLKQESYSRIDLPQYFRFDGLLTNVRNILSTHDLSSLRSESPRNFEAINHIILNNKDGRHAWRPLQLIHPGVYVHLVKKITESASWKIIQERFEEFRTVEKILCFSIPVESTTNQKDKAAQIKNWWEKIEQKSIELSLCYECMIHADIANCYGSIYSHSIAWAIHGKDIAKSQKQDKTLIGNIIDDQIQDMCQGQTNGIPQGSVIMDFISEMVLGYADLELAEKINRQNITDYLILRYRDDYRIFVNNPHEGERILKCLTEVMIGIGLKVNPGKIKTCHQVIAESIKADKLAWIKKKRTDKNLQKHLLIIYDHSLEFTNSGSVIVGLDEYFKRLTNYKRILNPIPLISIVVDIAYRNPRTYPICTAILSKLLSSINDDEEKKNIVEKIMIKFSQIPNTGHMEIWLQRICFPFAPDIVYEEPLCELMQEKVVSIWNNDWISSRDLKDALNPTSIFDKNIAENLDPVISKKEVELFISKTEYDQ